jgi:non-heme chloroperoxidase
VENVSTLTRTGRAVAPAEHALRAATAPLQQHEAETMRIQSASVILPSGITLDYTERGDRSGPALVLLHGYTDSWRSFGPLLAALPCDLRAIALSLRGHGDSDKPHSRYDVATLAADVAGLLESLQVEEAVLVGHSMGSLVAQRFAIDHPERTRGLILLGAFKAVKGNPDATALWDDTVAALQDAIPPGFVRDFQQSTLARTVPPDFFEMVVMESLKVPAHVWRSALRSLLDTDFSEETSKIATPTLILWGDQDVFCAKEEQQALKRAIAGARLITHRGAGHALHWEEPLAIAADITAFVKSCMPATARANRFA